MRQWSAALALRCPSTESLLGVCVAARRCGPSKPGTRPSPITASPVPSTEWERFVSPLSLLFPSLRAWGMASLKAGPGSARGHGFLCCGTTVLGFMVWFEDVQWLRDWQLLLAACLMVTSASCPWIFVTGIRPFEYSPTLSGEISILLAKMTENLIYPQVSGTHLVAVVQTLFVKFCNQI